MMKLVEQLREGGYSCVVANGEEVRCFGQRGIADLHHLLRNDPAFLCGSMIADKVVGKGAAVLMIKGGVKRLYSHTISEGALQLFGATDIIVEYDRRVPHIINRDKSDWCPVEKLCRGVDSVDEILPLLDEFVDKNKK